MQDRFDADALLEFLDYMVAKGLGKPETIKSRKIAVGRVLDTIGREDLDDLRQVDLDVIMERFFNLEGTKFSPSSMPAYKSRVNSAVGDFLRYRENPAGFKVLGQRKSRTKKVASVESYAEPESQVRDVPTRNQGGNKPKTIDGLSLPIPIRDDLIVSVSGLPFDLKRDEAQKIANVVLAMSAD